jgi:hypothetical protein
MLLGVAGSELEESVLDNSLLKCIYRAASVASWKVNDRSIWPHTVCAFQRWSNFLGTCVLRHTQERVVCLFFFSLLLCRFDFQTALQHLRTERLSTTRGYSAAPRLGTREGSRTCSVCSSMNCGSGGDSHTCSAIFRHQPVRLLAQR